MGKEMTRTYTAADFANAKFAEHPDGGTARTFPQTTAGARWSYGGAFVLSDEQMADEGWVPVPTKPTITQSLFDDIAESLMNGHLALEDFMGELGVEVIPDPEPTDEELLAGIIRGIDDWQSITSPELLAKYLNTAGVTPPNVKGN